MILLLSSSPFLQQGSLASGWLTYCSLLVDNVNNVEVDDIVCSETVTQCSIARSFSRMHSDFAALKRAMAEGIATSLLELCSTHCNYSSIRLCIYILLLLVYLSQANRSTE